MLLLFYFLFKIIKLVSVEKLCKRNTESVTYLFNGVQFRIHAFPIKDIIINAVMFLLIHFPIWIASGIFIDAFTSLNFLCVPALSIIFSWSFIKSKNIWIPITLHIFKDCQTAVLFYCLFTVYLIDKQLCPIYYTLCASIIVVPYFPYYPYRKGVSTY